MDRKQGFTLLEIMIVVAVLAIVIAMTIPGYMNSKKYANETSAIASLKIITTSQSQYRIRYGVFATLADLTGKAYMDSSFLDSEKSGYHFVMTGVLSGTVWAVGAEPITPGSSGDRWFYVDQSGVIRQKPGSAPGPSDAAVQ